MPLDDNKLLIARFCLFQDVVIRTRVDAVVKITAENMVKKATNEVPVSPIYFNVAEYCLFGIILGLIIGIIVYYNVINRKYKTVAGFLFGGKNMSVISICLALTSR